MTRNPIIRSWSDAIIADSFAGGGGASLGIELAIGRSPDIAINHDPEAIAMHAANHPETRHHIESVWEVDPREACGDRPVALAWFSPDCKHFSKAKGGEPRSQKIRGLAWVAVMWAQRVKPRVIVIENVEEFKDWGPLHRQGADAGRPIANRKGETFRAFVAKLAALGYVVEHKMLRACDYGAPTTRRRLFLIARCDGLPIRWPTPTHGPLAQPYRTAAECIDWSVPCPSIFARDKPLAEKTMARIARGVRKFVLDDARPFLMHVTHGAREHDIDTPMKTITAAHRGEFALAVPYLVHRSNGERVGQAPRIYDVRSPLGTIVAQGQKHALCAAFLAKHYSERKPGEVMGSSLHRSIDTITAQDHHSLVVAELGADLDRARMVADFMRRHGHDVGEFATVTIDGEQYVVVDIGMRMLVPRELFNAQGFTPGFCIDPHYNGKPLTKTAQIRMCGNSVSPPIAAAIVRAQMEAA